MSLEIAAVQRALKQDGLDGWLLYDFHGSNPIAARVAGLASSNKMATRRRYYLIPASGEPRGLVHAIESHNLEGLPGEKRQYAGRELLANGLRDLMRGMKKVAMEYSPGNAIPYISRVDAGTVEAVRALGVDVVSSGDLVQRFEAVWNDAALATHRTAAAALYRIKDRAFDLVRQRMASGTPVNEYDVQQAMVGWFKQERLVRIPRRAWRRRKTPATRITRPRPRSTVRSTGTKSSCSTSGASCPRPARLLLTSRGSATPARPCRNATRRRTEINMFIGEREAEVTGALQTEIVPLC